MSMTPRPLTPRTTSTQSSSSSKGLQHLLRRVRTALRRGSLSSRSTVATPVIDATPSTEVPTSANILPVRTVAATLQPTSQGASQLPISRTNATSVRHDTELPSSSNVEPISAVDSAHVSLVTPSSISLKHNIDTLLAVDDDENALETIDEPLIPLSQLGRASTGIAEAKARQLFELHGLTYHTRADAGEEPATKIRRVEKSVRMRVRWTCHSCRTVFGQDKYCPGCGHRRCFECDRNPRRRVRMPSREDMAQEPDLRIQPTVVQTLPSRPRPSQAPFNLPDTTALHTLVDRQSSHGAEASPWRCTIQIGQPRPHTTPLQDHPTTATTPAHRRDCHQCETTTERVEQSDCASCGHLYCILCPLYTNTASHMMQINRTVPVVQRVYRKPRQRVRFHCEHCDTQYTDRNNCANCGHERCENCPRFPPKKQKVSPDPLAWQALQAKIAKRHDSDPLMTIENEPPLQQTTSEPQARL